LTYWTRVIYSNITSSMVFIELNREGGLIHKNLLCWYTFLSWVWFISSSATPGI